MTETDTQSADQIVSLGELEDSLGFLLRIAQVHAFQRFYDAFGEDGPRPGEFSVMWVIRRNPGIRQGLLAERLQIKPAQMTKMIRRLEDQGHVERVIPDNDRRSVELCLTRAGEALTEAHRSAFFSHDDHHHLDLTERESHQLAHLLRRYIGLEKGTIA